MFIQRSTLTASITSVLSLTLATSAQAISIDFNTWTPAGDVVTPAIGEASISTNALDDDDFFQTPPEDNNYNFSGTSAEVDPFDLAENLGLNGENELHPDLDKFVFVTDGSGLTQQFIFAETTELSFNWRFLTNDEIFSLEGMEFGDYAFLAVNGMVTDTFGPFSNPSAASSPQPICLSGSECQYINEVTGNFSQNFAPGTYEIALGVVDVDDVSDSSALSINNAQLNSTNVPRTPEPASPLSLFLLGLLTVKVIAKNWALDKN